MHIICLRVQDVGCTCVVSASEFSNGVPVV